jgi:hypothetical protein
VKHRILSAIFLILFLFLLLPLPAVAKDLAVFVDAGDTEALIDAVNNANDGSGPSLIFVRAPQDGNSEFVFDEPIEGTDSALPAITGNVEIFPVDSRAMRITFRRAENAGNFRLAHVKGNGDFIINGFNIRDFNVMGNGGALLASDQGKLSIQSCNLRNNFASGNGGAVATEGLASLRSSRNEYTGNRCSGVGGALSIEGMSSGNMNQCVFADNVAGVFGCDINVNSTGTGLFGRTLWMSENVFGSSCGNVLVENPRGIIGTRNNSFTHPTNGIDSTDLVQLFGNLFNVGPPGSSTQDADLPESSIKAACNDFGSGAFSSQGYNLSSDESCALDQDTDLDDTDPMVADNGDGLPEPVDGSPAIDSGAAEVMVFGNDPLASLPCGYADVAGTGRPQDGDGDGTWVCDRGAIEVMGKGNIQAGHSGVFFNAQRDGEGNYVEILDDDTAVVYTFTYRPDGSGPAWFLGVGDVNGNSIVINELLRPIGTSFGDGFDPEDVELSEIGGMSMVFGNCKSFGKGGGVAYSGEFSLGYEGLLSRASRLGQVTGCDFTPVANAGLSGTFYDPARDGEGVIVEWLSDGRVIVIFFTYDENDNQFWAFGIGDPTDKTVTMNVLYPSGVTSWGSGFKESEVVLNDWGTFTLTWTSCHALTFQYASTVGGMGSATRNYSRLTMLQETSCPEF